MKRHMSTIVLGTAGLLVGMWATGTAGQSGTTGPMVNPAAVVAKAGTPPPAGAATTKVAGMHKTKVTTANSPADDDSFWVERLDVDGDGDVEDTNLVWDDEDKVLFAYSAGAFMCRNGGTATAELLVAANAAGNPRHRPAGSGFWVADLDKGECGAKAAGLWGCNFNAKGHETECGAAVLDEKNDELNIVTTSTR